jgi:chromosome partitioning protein
VATSIAVVSGKGGVGKTSIAVNLAYTLARMGRLVLAVDLDSNPGLTMELGMKADPSFDDGAGLMTAFMGGGPPAIIQRSEELHIVPGGFMLKALPGMEPVWSSAGRRPESALRDILDPLARQYDYIIIDSPPGGQGNAAQLALGAADFCLIPTRTDTISIQGVSDMAMLIHQARASVNPGLHILGVVLFDLPASATVENADARRDVEAVVDGVAPVLNAAIRESHKASRRARKHGMPVLQYDEEIVARAKPWYEDKAAARKVAPRAGALAKDYVALAGEVVGLIQIAQSRSSQPVPLEVAL